MSATAFQRRRREQEAKRLKENTDISKKKVAEIKELLDEKEIEYDPKAKRKI